MTSVIEDHTHNYGKIKGIQQHTFSLRSIQQIRACRYVALHAVGTQRPWDSGRRVP